MKLSDLTIDDEYITVADDEDIETIAKKFTETGITDAVVVKDGKPIGVIDDFDIISKVVAEGKDAKATPVKDVMHAPPTVTQETDLKRLEQIFDELNPSVVPVVDENGSLLGVVTLMDIIQARTRPRSIFSWFGGRKA